MNNEVQKREFAQNKVSLWEESYHDIHDENPISRDEWYHPFVGNLNVWQKEARSLNDIQTVYLYAPTEIFFKDDEVINENMAYRKEARDYLFSQISNDHYNNLVFLLTTNSPENIVDVVPDYWLKNPPHNVWFGFAMDPANQKERFKMSMMDELPFDNKFLLIESQTKQFVDIDLSGIKWVVQGYNMNKPDYHASLMKISCHELGIPFFQTSGSPHVPKVRDYPRFERSRKNPLGWGAENTTQLSSVKIGSPEMVVNKAWGELYFEEVVSNSVCEERTAFTELKFLDNTSDEPYELESVCRDYRVNLNPETGNFKPLVRITARYDKQSDKVVFKSFLEQDFVVEISASQAVEIAKFCINKFDRTSFNTNFEFDTDQFRIVSDYVPSLGVVSQFKHKDVQ